MKKEKIYLDEEIKLLISQKTGFDKNKIKLILSKKLDDQTDEINYHKFSYNRKIYILKNNVLQIEK